MEMDLNRRIGGGMMGVGYVECPAFEGGSHAVILAWMFLLNMIGIRSCLRVRVITPGTLGFVRAHNVGNSGLRLFVC